MKNRKKTRLLDRMRKIPPRLFENLIYDLLVRRGLGNVKWRTPGADGGRDIEGEYVVSDFAGSSRTEKWYVECKRYSRTLDWPTVHGKLAYAHNQGADYLLIATTASLSPNARDEVAIWNRIQRKPAIREWGGVDIEHLLSRDSLLVEKYGLSNSKNDRAIGSIPLLTVVTKLIHEVYGKSFALGAPSTALEFAAAASEFAGFWLNAANPSKRHPIVRLDFSRDIYQWCDVSPSAAASQLNPYVLRAVLACLRFFLQENRISVSFPLNSKSRMIVHVPMQCFERARPTLQILCTMADWEVTDIAGKLIFEARVKQ